MCNLHVDTYQQHFSRKQLSRKTKMCQDPETCLWGDKCRYAHNRHELTTLEDNARNMHWYNYRTKLCKHFIAGKCKFGNKCSFLHLRRLPIFKQIIADSELT